MAIQRLDTLPIRSEGTRRERARGEIFGGTENSSRLGVPTMSGTTSGLRGHKGP